jgi:predicted ATP-binding protein involved in virulence
MLWQLEHPVVQELTKIYVSYHRDDLEAAVELYTWLKNAGFSPWMIDEDVFPGEETRSLCMEAIVESDIFISLISNKSTCQYYEYDGLDPDDIFYDLKEFLAFELDSFLEKTAEDRLVIPIFLDTVPAPITLSKYQSVDLTRNKETALKRLKTGIDRFQKRIKKRETRSISRPGKSSREIQNLIIAEVELKDIRCFHNVKIKMAQKNSHIRWTMLLGNNAVGKSTLLKCIALSLCNESDAVALMKTASGEFLRKGEQEGFIKVHLREDNGRKNSKKYTITTRITLKPEDGSEIVRKETEPATDFPWSDIFVCGYGAYRAAQAHSSFEQYEARDAVATLFDSQASLQNPEIVLLRNDPAVREQLEQKLLKILMLDEPDYKLNFTKRGIELDGPWGCLPFQVLSDGYRSTTQWVLDFIGWLIHAERLIDNEDIGGILLIDELEQHLHPRWQRYIVQRLRQQFPRTQIIASTHTPLAASGIVDQADGLLLKLEQRTDSSIEIKEIDKQLLAGKRADQVLTSEAFGLITTRNPGSEDEINRYTALLSRSDRTEAEETELQALKQRVQNTLRSGENAVEQMVATAVDETLQNMTQTISPEMLNIETRKQLLQLFHPEAAE